MFVCYLLLRSANTQRKLNNVLYLLTDLDIVIHLDVYLSSSSSPLEIIPGDSRPQSLDVERLVA